MVGEVGVISCDYQSINLAGLVPCSGSLQRALPLAGGASPAHKVSRGGLQGSGRWLCKLHYV